MTRPSTHEDYNAPSRSLLYKLEIYFDGISSSPLVVTRSNYLMNCSGLDEAGAEDSNPLGAISANEIDFTLFNKDAMFNPANTTSPYYGKMKLNVPVKVFMKPDKSDVDWDPLGLFYVTNWAAPSAGTTADVTAADILQQVFLKPKPNIPVEHNKTFKEMFEQVFTALGFTAIVSDLLTEELNYTYADDKPRALLQELLRAAVAYCTTDASGNIVVKPFRGSGVAVATLTDSDQINSLEIKQSILKTYDGVALTYHLHQLSDQESLIDIKGLAIEPGDTVLDAVSFSKSPVKSIVGIRTTSTGNMIAIKGFEYSTNDIVITTTNNGALVDCDIMVNGIAVETTPVLLSDECSNPLKIENKYIQTATYATAYKEILKKFVDNPIPTLTLKVRGNPRINVGDKVIIDSAKYKLVYTGIVQRHTYEYSGGLTSELTLLNALILEG